MSTGTATTDTRTALIDAAEHVFARDGFEGASLREIMRDAGANPAAVHYHFGGKDGLLEHVLDRVVGPIVTRRMHALAVLREQRPTGPLPVRDLAEAFLRPDFDAIAELRARGPGRAALIGHAYAQPTDHVRELMYRQFDPVGAAFFLEFIAALAPRDAATVRWRLRWAVVGVIVALFGNADEPDGPVDDEAFERTVDFVVAGLEAPTA